MHSSWTPSKKTLQYIGVLLLITISIIFITSWVQNNKKEDRILKSDVLVRATQREILDRDTDGDGLMDWEELLWGLDPTKKDTDGNGISDFEEVERKKIELQKDALISTSTKTITDQFARNFFATFSALRASGSLTTENVRRLSEQSVSNLQSVTLPNKYTENDILVSNTLSIKDYKENLKQISKKVNTKPLGTEAYLLGRAIGKPRSEKLVRELQKIEQLYIALAEEVRKQPAPVRLRRAHLELVNTYYNLGVAVGGLSEIYTDPALSVIYFAQYKKNLDTLFKVSTQIQNSN